MKNTLKAGIAITEISPKQGIQLTGYPHYDRANTGIHDSLYASCIYLDNGKDKIAIVSMDILKYPKKFVRVVRERASIYTGIPANNIMICCTHTHSGPLVSTKIKNGIDKATKLQLEYEQQLENKISNLILEAYNNSFPAKVGIGKGHCGKEQGVGGNRRNPDGPADPEVWTIGLKDLEGRWRGVIVKYALHPTVIHGESTVVTADYPCYIRRYFAESKPGITSLFLQGTSGNQSSRFFRDSQTYKEAKRIGETIAKEADRVLDEMVFSDDIELVARSLETDVEIREFPSLERAQENIKKAQIDLQKLIDDKVPYTKIRTAEVNLLGAENIYNYALAREKGEKIEVLEDEMPVEVQVIGIGDTRLVGVQGEMFVEYGFEIKEKSPFKNTFVIELANGCLPGYVCTKEAYDEGGYEAGTSMMTGKAGEQLVETAVKVLKLTNV